MADEIELISGFFGDGEIYQILGGGIPWVKHPIAAINLPAIISHYGK
jgi:hypothetical protein